MLLKGAYCVGEHFVDPQGKPLTILGGWVDNQVDLSPFHVCGFIVQCSKLYVSTTEPQGTLAY